MVFHVSVYAHPDCAPTAGALAWLEPLLVEGSRSLGTRLVVRDGARDGTRWRLAWAGG